ncbi:intein N-terminal splicing region/RHS repeat-associated core domain-containing protein [Promicromonospora umidemergens]|uniref:RHS repeat-associated core domain-containing protein n=1 Tax=Promicromonospora umidemergens TaxID=629679 RepID=A0ABP8XIK1_9MICO|nr:polymorphic toxin-type HINT domain-containing protein [Promicromonospora umidemergens]MCP2282811.1 intein N-terminal splicing region/RHS repeat-associated core domain-containing protein [Promicromonospora umidemergens]
MNNQTKSLNATSRSVRGILQGVAFTTVGALVATLFIAVPQVAAQPTDDGVGPGSPGLDVAGADFTKPSTKTLPDPAQPKEREADLPAGGHATLDLRPADAKAPAEGMTTVGGLPLDVTAADQPGDVAPDQVDVDVISASSDKKRPGQVLVALSVPQVKAAGTSARSGAGVWALSAVDVTVDYSGFAGLHGGSWEDRLTLVQLPECAVDTPQKAQCATGQPVGATNRTDDDTLVAEKMALPADGSPVVLAVAASVSGDSGSFGATPLSPSNTWSTDLRSGSFSWNYPITVPDVPGSFVPTLGLSYSSGGVDGRTSSTNNQASLVGDGFNLWPGYIERKYKSCALDEEKNADGGAIGDLCWDYDNAFISFNGAAGELVPAGSNSWRLQNDDGTKIERLTDTARSNGDNDGEYWKVTTPDGTQYFFGYHRLPGWAAGDSVTNSAWTVPVVGNNTGEPCSTSPGKICTQAWRWNLDYAIDAAGNKITYHYQRHSNRYGKLGDPAADTVYHRSGSLTKIEYGLRGNDLVGTGAAQPLGRVSFTYAQRCLNDGSGQCSNINTQPNGWHDVPWDLNCNAGATCDQGRTSPSFWTRNRMTGIKAQVYVSSAWKNVDSWALDHEWGMADADYQLLLSSIRRTGHTGPEGAATTSLDPVRFGYTQLANRLDRSGDGRDPFIKARLSTIQDEVGGQVDVGYSNPGCDPDNLPTPHNNTSRCFPQIRSQGEVRPAITDWFNKYVVTGVTTTDRTGGGDDMLTTYEYLGGGAWHWDESTGLIPAEEKTWSDWRGYGHVRVKTGSVTQRLSQTEHWFLRGMHGDRATRDGGTKTEEVTLGSGEGDPITDRPYWAGFTYKTASFTGPGGAVVSKSVNRPWWHQTGIKERDWGTIRSGFSRTAQAEKFTSLGSGGAPWRTTQTQTSYDEVAGRVTQVADKGDTSTSSDDRCSTISYATNTSKNILGLHERKQTWAAGCGASPTAAQVVNDTRYAYDGQGYGTAPVRGRITRTADLARVEGTTRHYVEASAGFDTYGRPTSLTDVSADLSAGSNGNGTLTRTARSDGHTSTTAYTPSSGFATQMVETTPPATPGDEASALTTTTRLDPVRGGPTLVTDTNTKSTVVAYDALGRTSKIWLADRTSNLTPSVEFTYQVQASRPVAVGTTTLDDDGDRRATSWAVYDGLLRPRQTQDPGLEGGMILSDTKYDARGLVKLTYSGYYTTSATGGRLFDPYEQSLVETQTRHSYDGLGRAIRTRVMSTDSDGGDVLATTRSIYRGDRTTVIPPTGATATTTLADARGRVVQLRQHHDPAAATPEATSGFDTTRYTYTGRDQLATVTDPADNVWEYTYDQRGREIRTVDPDAGETSTTYDDFGRMVSTTNAEGEKLVNAYDGLGRQTELRENTASGPLRASWIYDTVSGAKGYLAQSIRHENEAEYVTRTVGYDRLYRPTRTVTQIPSVEGELSGNYITNTSYTAAGNVESMGLPAAGDRPGESVSFSYDEATSWVTGVHGQWGLTATTAYDWVGKPLQHTLSANAGGQVQATNTYEYGTQRLSNYRVDRVGQLGVDRSETYTYDDAGNITALADVSRTGTDVQCFDLDHLNRITEAWTQNTTDVDCAATGRDAASDGLIGGSVAQYWHEYTYDAAGSRQREALHSGGGQRLTSRNYNYDPAQPHTVTSVDQVQPASGNRPRVESVEQYTYDAVGRTTSRQIGGDTQTLSWTPESRVSELANADDSGAQYTYDADGNRLIARNTNADGSSESTLYLGHTEITVTSSEPTVAKATRYIDVGGGHTAVVDDAGAVTFVMADHHGTGQLAITAANQAVTQRRTTPFGQDRGTPIAPGDWASSRGFVGGYDDRETTGLVSLGAREYDPALGRFISLDPIMDLSDPQQIHGYSYANNNPVTLSDPTGLCPGGGVMLDGAFCDFGDGWQQVKAIDTGGATTETVFTQGQSPTQAAMQATAAMVRSPGPGITGGSASNAGNPGAATAGPTEAEIAAKAREVLNKSITDVAIELGWEALKDFIGWNDLMGCLDKDIASCAMLAVGILPVGKGLKAIKAFGKIIDGAISFYKQQKSARKILDQVGATRKAPSCNSFVPGTMVLLADGTKKPIEDIELGDKVLAADEDTGEKTEGREVTALITGEGNKALVTITVTDTEGDKQKIVATDEHPVWVPGLQVWVDAIDLNVGDWLQTSAGTWAQVSAIDVEQAHAVVHNLTVATDHTYYVAGSGAAVAVLVHNEECPYFFPDELVDTQHAVDRHTVGGPEHDARSGTWKKGTSAQDLLDLAADARGEAPIGLRGNFEFHMDAGRIIGVNGSGQSVTTYLVVRGRYDGSLMSMYPK